MREMKLLKQLDSVFPPYPDACRGPLPHSIYRQDGRVLKGRRKKGAGGVGLMVTRINKSLGVARQLLRLKRSSWAAATIFPSTTRAAAESW